MGYWTITINGYGCHHNPEDPGVPADANKMARQFVVELCESGHEISHASMTYGSTDQLMPLSGWIRTRGEIPAPPKGSAKPTALSIEEVQVIERNERWSTPDGWTRNGFRESTWTNGNFQKLIDTVKILHAELSELRPIVSQVRKSLNAK